MLIGGFILTTLFHLFIGFSAALLPEGTFKAYCIMIFIIGLSLAEGTIGPLVWLLLAEIFPLKSVVSQLDFVYLFYGSQMPV